MSENIDGVDLLGSGGHVWIWSGAQPTRKIVGTAGVKGAFGMATSLGPRPCRITGKNGSPALLRAASDAALTTIEASIELAEASAGEYAWSDDLGHSGTALTIVAYRRVGPRVYGSGAVWQYYEMQLMEMAGGF